MVENNGLSFRFFTDPTSHKNIVQFIKRIFISEKTITQFLSGTLRFILRLYNWKFLLSHHFNEYAVICILIINVSKLLIDLIATKIFAFWKFCTLFFIYYNPKYLGFYFMWAVQSARKNHKFLISRAPRIRERNYSCNFSTRFWSWYKYFPSIQLFPEILEQSV